jgi:hypothetical protein
MNETTHAPLDVSSEELEVLAGLPESERGKLTIEIRHRLEEHYICYRYSGRYINNQRTLHNSRMDDSEAGRYWEQNAEAWTRLCRQGYDVYRDCSTRPRFWKCCRSWKG